MVQVHSFKYLANLNTLLLYLGNFQLYQGWKKTHITNCLDNLEFLVISLSDLIGLCLCSPPKMAAIFLSVWSCVESFLQSLLSFYRSFQASHPLVRVILVKRGNSHKGTLSRGLTTLQGTLWS